MEVRERVDEGPIGWEDFKLAFLDYFFPLELREEKMRAFINLKQDNICVGEYALKFTKLSKYVPSLVADPRNRMSQFMSGLYDLVAKECRTTMLVKEMNISRLMIYAKQMEDEMLRERRMRESKRARFDGGFSKSKTNGGNGHVQQGQRYSGQGSSNAPTPRFVNDIVLNPKPHGGVPNAQVFPSCKKCEELIRENVWQD